MEDRHSFLIWFAFAVLTVIVIWEIQKPSASAATTPAPTADLMSPTDSLILTPDNQSGTDYLTYNTPYAFAPPVQNFLPNTTIGQVGQVAGQGPSPDASCSVCSGGQ